MAGDRKIFSERGKEKAPSQSQPRDFTKKQYQQNNAKSLEIDKKRVSLKGGMNQIEQRRIERIKEAENRPMSRDNRGSHVNKKRGDLSERGKEKAPSQSQPRDLKNNNTNKKDAERLELNKNRVPLKGGGVVGAGSLDLRWEHENLIEAHVARRKLKKSSDEDTTEQQ